MNPRPFLSALLLLPTLAIGAPTEPVLALNPGEHVAIVGNALADRMQHHGWLEAMLHARHPSHRLVVRNLAFSGDEVATRARSKDFGTPDEWLTRVQAGVVLAFFGFNESFRGEAGLPAFKEELARFLRETRAQNYNGLGPPRIVLFSPIANERHPDPALAVPPENNANLALYTAAMAEVARDREGVTFVDLFAPSQQLFAEAAAHGRPLTFNGIHLTEDGEAKLAERIFPALFGGAAPPVVDPQLRAAVNDKNAQWHARYRTLDGYNVYGGRSQGAFSAGEGRPKISNFQVMQEEFAQRDVLTANGELRVWGLAQGRDLSAEARPLPPVTHVPTTKPGPNPDGSHVFLSGEAAIEKMTVHAGLKVNLFASEAQFPELTKPVQMAWDTRGRLWVAVWPNYPLRKPESAQGDRLLILEDTDGDGRADRCTTFLDDLNGPTGFQFYKDGVLIVQAPDLWFVRDTNGDGRGDWKERVLMGLDSADTHHQANSLALDPGGALYLSDGVFHRTQVETALGPVRNIDAAIYRYEPNTGRFETYVAYNFANPHGRAFDRWGNDLITDGTGNRTYFGPAFSGRLDYPAKHPTLKEFWPRPSRPSATSTLLTSRHFPADFQGNFLNGNVIGFQGFFRVRVLDDGSGLKGEQLPDLLSSSDPNFRPSAINVGPDGAVYFADWHSPIIAHTNLNHLRDPNRGFEYGRIYRVTHEGRALLAPPRIHDQPPAALLELLKEPENHVRELAKIELGRHEPAAVMAALQAWVRRLDERNPDYQHHLMEALWVHQWHNVVESDLLRRMLRSPQAEARAAATRVLCYWRDRVPDALALLRERAADEHPRVRLQAVRAASFFPTLAAVEVALTALSHPLDYYLEYTLDETLKQLKPHWREHIAADSPLVAGVAQRIERLLRTVTPAELLHLPRTNEVLGRIVTRPGVPESARAEALAALVGTRRVNATEVLLELVQKDPELDASGVGRLLLAQPAAGLRAAWDGLARLATEPDGKMRSQGWAALIIAHGSVGRPWEMAAGSPAQLADLLAGITLLPDVALRAGSYERVLPLVEKEPDSSVAGAAAESGAVRRAAIRAAVSGRRESDALFRVLSGLIRRGVEVPVAAEGLRGLPRASWVDTELTGVLTGVLAWAKGIAASGRNAPDYLATLQLAEEMLARLPPDEAKPLVPQLRSVRSSRYIVRAVPEEMRFDTPRIIVEAGRSFTLIFENPDAMPHNLLVVKPGARERIGRTAMELPPNHLDGRGRAYTPDSPDVIAATKLLEPGTSELLYIVAPFAEGTYEYVCTFPGHWVTMWGELVVTNDPDAYRARGKFAAGAAETGTTAGATAGHRHESR